MPEVKSVIFVSKEEALERMRVTYEDPGVLDGLTGTNNPLPASIEVELVDFAEAESFAAQLDGRSEVDEVRYGAGQCEADLELLSSVLHSWQESRYTTHEITLDLVLPS